MEFESASHAYDTICRGFYIESPLNGDPIPMVSNHHKEGVIAVIYSTKDEAVQAAENASQSYKQDAVVKPEQSLQLRPILNRVHRFGYACRYRQQRDGPPDPWA